MTLKLYVAFSVAAPGGTTQTSLLRDAFAGRRATSRVKPLCTRPARMCETPVAPAKEASKGAVDNARVALGPVFVAGANGRVGQRIVRLLAEAGIPVRAAVRTKSKMRPILNTLDETSRSLVELVSFDATEKNVDSIIAALGDSKVVISALGSTEGLNLFSFSQIDGFAVKRIMETAARSSTVRQLVIVSSIGVGSPLLFPAAILNLFGGVLLWKDFSERATARAARAASKSYFIVRPGGMERQGDDFGETHNVRLAPRGTLGGGVVSRMQIAQLIVAGILNEDAVRNKTVEVVAEITAPQVELDQLLEKANEDSHVL